MRSIRNIPVRYWIIFLMLLEGFLTMAVYNMITFSWKYMTVTTIQVRYQPWCFLTEEQRLNKMIGKIPWYNISRPDYGPRYNWKPEHKDYILHAQLIGTLLSTVPAGVLAEWVGPYYTLLYTTVVIALLNGLRVLFISMHWKTLLISEFFMGIHIGLIYPALNVWIARWAPPNERGIFVAANIGNGLAVAIAKIFLRYITPTTGWQSIYYVNTGLLIIFVVILWLLGENSPEKHKRISDKEIYYIKVRQKGKVTPTKTCPPYGRILTSSAFWALSILLFGTTCADIYFQSIIGTFLFTFLGISKRLVELIEFLPYLCNIIVAVGIAFLADFLRTKEISNDTTLVRAFAVLSHIIPGFAIIFLSMTRCYQNIALILHFVGYSLVGCSYISVYRTAIDIAPNYAGTIYGLIRIWYCLGKMVIPTFIQYIWNLDKGIIGWCLTFLFGGGCILGTGIIFLFFGQGKCQWWNLKSEDRFKTFYYKNPDEASTSGQTSEQTN